MSDYYTVECDEDGCESCGAGKSWQVVDGEGVGGGTSYHKREDAEEIADLLNDAYERGKAASSDARLLRMLWRAAQDAGWLLPETPEGVAAVEAETATAAAAAAPREGAAHG